MYDVIIIGGGPSGLTAAIYTSRRALKTLVITRDIGGQASKTSEIENYPGVKKISGIELSTKFKAQAESFGAEFSFEEVIKITKGDLLSIKTINNEYKSKSIIIASGKKPRELGIPGENEFKGKGVSYCATCDVPFFKGKTLAVAGGGNSAVEGALLAEKFCKKVYLVHRRDTFAAENILVEKAKSSKTIEIILSEEILEIKGGQTVKSILLKGGREIETDGVLVEVGYTVDRTLLNGLLEMDERNQVKVDNIQKTSEAGIFAAGDLTTTPYKQIIISAAEGAKAALSCYDYIQKLAGKRGIIADWH